MTLMDLDYQHYIDPELRVKWHVSLNRKLFVNNFERQYDVIKCPKI